MDPEAARFVAELPFAASSRGVSGCEVAPDRTKVAKQQGHGSMLVSGFGKPARNANYSIAAVPRS